MDTLQVDGRDAATFCGIDVSSVGVSVSAPPTRCNVTAVGVREIDNEETESAVVSHLDTSTTFNSQTFSPGVVTSTGLTVKVEPDVEEQNNSLTSRQENDKRCHDSLNDDVTASRCVQLDAGRLYSVHHTDSSPSVSFSHRRDCPRGPQPSTAASSDDTSVDEGHTRYRRRRPGLSRLKRIELRQRSRIAMDVTEDVADGVDGTASMAVKGLRLGVDRAASSDVISAEPQTMTSGQNRVPVSDVYSKTSNTACDVAVEPDSGTVVHSMTTEMLPTAFPTSSVVAISTTMTTARQAPENRRVSENKSNERATTDVKGDRQATSRCVPAEIKRLLTLTAPADRASATAAETAGIFPAVSTRSFDVSRMSAANYKAAPLSVRRTVDRDVSQSSVVNTTVRVPSTPVFQRTLTQSGIADAATGDGCHAVRPQIVDAARCYVGGAVKWRRCCGDVKKPRDIVMWMQTRRVSLAAPVLRCALTALKCNSVALVNSPTCFIPRHMSIVYPSYRLLWYPASPCV